MFLVVASLWVERRRRRGGPYSVRCGQVEILPSLCETLEVSRGDAGTQGRDWISLGGGGEKPPAK